MNAMEYENLRRRFKPTSVRTLFVGESRPAGGTFFYAANSKLFSATREAFSAVYGGACPDREEFLLFFQSNGCYLDDLCKEPVNGLAIAERERARERGVAPLAERVIADDPKAVIVVMLGIVAPVSRALDAAARKTQRPQSPLYSLPFPRPEHRARYVRELADVLRKVQK